MSELGEAIAKLSEKLGDPELDEEEFNILVSRRRRLLAEAEREGE